MATAQLTTAGVGIHNVLIATDFSCYSNEALKFGMQLARDYHANAYVTFVVPSSDFLLAGPEAYVAAKAAAERDLQQLKAELKRTYAYIDGEHYQLYLLEGEVAEAILDFARRTQVDLIVVGTHGRGGLGKALLGSVAERVFRASPVPVLTIGPHLRRVSRANAPRNILVAVDFTPASERAVQYAAFLAREHRSNLALLHVLDPKELERVPDRARVLQVVENKLGTLIGPEMKADCALRVEVGQVVPTILQTADELEADLLVLGVRRSLGVLDRLVWPHAYELVRQASCPVLTIRATES